LTLIRVGEVAVLFSVQAPSRVIRVKESMNNRILPAEKDMRKVSHGFRERGHK
jgi:hypothetical protein